MGVLARAPAIASRNTVVSHWPIYLGVIVYTGLAGSAILRHEPWADEAQAWLLARDNSLFQLWTRLLHYEGTPGLWHSLLHALIRFGLPYSGLNVLSGLFGLAAAGVLLRYAPFPAAVRLALPLTFYLCYQYAVVARSYCLLPLLLFICAAWYPSAAERPLRFATILSLIAAVSVHGAVMAGSIALAAGAPLLSEWRSLEAAARKRLVVAGAAWVTTLALIMLAAWPAKDGTFVTGPNLSSEHFMDASGRMFRQAFTGEIWSSVAVVALSVPVLWRGRGLLPFAVSALLLCTISAVIYSHVWHQGLLFLAWLVALWVSAGRVRTDKPVLAALALVIAIQCYWTFESVRYDWSHAYSGSREAAQYLRAAAIPPSRLYAIGYACTGLQPYFDHNIFGNFTDGKAYWDWSSRNHVNQSGERLGDLRPEFVLVGYKGAFEHDFWTSQVIRSGYRAVAHFEGNIFWKSRILEPESYDLYKR